MKNINVIGIAGKKRSGKDTIARVIRNIKPESFTYHMSKPLKKSCAILFDLDNSQLHEENKDVLDHRWGLTPRQIFQKLGTDFLRNAYDPQFFIIHLDYFLKSNNARLFYGASNKDFVIIPDIRFQNEVDYIKEKWEGKVIRVVRDFGFDDPHPSEREILNLKNIDYEIDNNSSLYDLNNSAYKFMNKYYNTDLSKTWNETLL
jgi:hypothetical protein